MHWSRFRRGLSLALVALVLAFLVLPAVGPTASAAEPPGLQKAMQAQERHTARLMAMPDVVGTAVGLGAQGQPVVKVLTARGGVAGIPANVDGVPVEVKVTGVFFAIPGPPRGKKPPPEPGVDPTSRFEDPVPIGVSVGNEWDCSAGTLGCRVTDGISVYALSNLHVFDPDQNSNLAENCERIVQPARLDDPADNCSGLPTQNNIFGWVVDYEPIEFGGVYNTIDAAIAEVPAPFYYPGSDPPAQWYWGDLPQRGLGTGTPPDGYGTPNSTTVGAQIGMAVQKYGRSTGLTKGQVSLLNATVTVSYVDGVATFENQICLEGRKFLKPGDSGSLVVTNDSGKNPVGLLFAGNTPGSLGIANPIDAVLAAFGVTIDGTPADGE